MVDSPGEAAEQFPHVEVFAHTRLRALPLALVAALSFACAVATSSSEPSAAPEPAPAPAANDEEAGAQTGPEPTPLVEIDPATVPEPTPPAAEPDPPAEPLPLSAEQLERIYAVQDIVADASATYDVDPTLVNGLIWVESKFEVRARGPAGAQGLMQLMPKTASSLAKRLGRKRASWDPDFNIHAGTLMLSRLLARFEGDVRLALAGYNRGGGTVSSWVANNEALPEGAEKFVLRVLAAQALFQRLPPASTPQPTPAPRSAADARREAETAHDAE